MINLKKPRAMLWAEAFGGSGHMQVASQLARELTNQDFDVDLLTSSMHVGKQFDFGDQTNIIELERIISGRGEPHIKTKEGAFLCTPQCARPYLKVLEQALSKENRSTRPDPKLISQAWDQLIEPLPLGSWQKELRRYLIGRQEILRCYYQSKKPNVIVTEFWPYGRVDSNCELVPFMEHVKASSHQPLVFSLERDILLSKPIEIAEPSSDPRVLNTNNYVSEVLVRGDNQVFELEDTFPNIDQVRKPILYMGYYTSPMLKRREMPEDEREVIVSAGGAFQDRFIKHYQTAIAAKNLTCLKNRTWRLLIAPNCPEETFQELIELAKDDAKIIIERNKPSKEYKQLLTDSALSITQGGYNSTIEVASSEAPAIIVPLIKSDSELNEQSYRAEKFEQMGCLSVINRENTEDAENFARLIDEAYHSQRKNKKSLGSIQVDGAKRTAEHIAAKVARSRAAI